MDLPKLEQLAAAAQVFAAHGFKPTAQALNRSLSQSRSLIEQLAQGADGKTAAEKLIRLETLGSQARQRLDALLKGRTVHHDDPDDVCFMSEKSGTVIDEVFIGSCMTNIGHFRAASKLLEGKSDIPVRLWVAPPTKMDAQELSNEGHYGVLGRAGARMEMPGCSLCMGNQAQVREGATVMSTSTRNFPNRLGKNTFVYLGSAELAAICSKLGKIPTIEEYQANIGIINEQGDQIYRYMNFNEIESYNEVAEKVNV